MKTLEEIKNKKEHIEKLITNMLKDFEEDTGVEIVDIDIDKIRAFAIKKEFISNIELEVRIN